MKKALIIVLAVVVVGLVGFGIYKLVVREAVVVNVNVNVTEENYSGVLDFTQVKNNLNNKNTKIDIGNQEETDTYGSLSIENSRVVLDLNYPKFGDLEKREHTKFVVSKISNPVSVYFFGEVGGEDSYPVEFYVMDKDNNIYVVSFLVRLYENSDAKIYKVINNFSIDYISQTSSNTINVTNGSEKGNLQSLEFISNKNYTANTSNSYFSQYDDIEEFDGDPTVLVHDNVAEVILYQAKEDYDFELFTINLVGTPKVVVSYYMASDLAQFFMYVLNENGELYRYTIDMHKLDKVAITKLNIKDVVAITDVLVPLDDEAPLEGNEYIIIKTIDNNYYKDYTYNGNKLVKLN